MSPAHHSKPQQTLVTVFHFALHLFQLRFSVWVCTPGGDMNWKLAPSLLTWACWTGWMLLCGAHKLKWMGELGRTMHCKVNSKGWAEQNIYNFQIANSWLIDSSCGTRNPYFPLEEFGSQGREKLFNWRINRNIEPTGTNDSIDPTLSHFCRLSLNLAKGPIGVKAVCSESDGCDFMKPHLHDQVKPLFFSFLGLFGIVSLPTS